METKSSHHTPGPWEAEDVGAGDWEISKGNKSIASLSIHRPEIEANARLIAASPEMLEALKALQGTFWFKAGGDVSRPPDGWVSPKDAFILQVNAAIAMAEGREED